jgi:hypothetical protein
VSTTVDPKTLDPEVFDRDLEPEVQTGKQATKVVPCRECKRALVVTTFFAPAKAICRTCRGENDTGVASVGQPIAGQTDPVKAVNLADCLLNPHFAEALCPVHPDDPDHEMELKAVSHNEHYGPSQLTGYTSRGVPQYRQLEKGETVMHQCKVCRAVVTYSTTAQTQFRRMNEPTEQRGRGSESWIDTLEARSETPVAA